MHHAPGVTSASIIHWGGSGRETAAGRARSGVGAVRACWGGRSAQVGAGFHVPGAAGWWVDKDRPGQAGCRARRRSKASATWVAQAHPVGIFSTRVRAWRTNRAGAASSRNRRALGSATARSPSRASRRSQARTVVLHDPYVVAAWVEATAAGGHSPASMGRWVCPSRRWSGPTAPGPTTTASVVHL